MTKPQKVTKTRFQKNRKIRSIDVKKIIINIVVFVFAFCANAQASPSDEAEALFAQGEYLQGRNILTKALNNPDPVQRAYALQAYARFYENIAGNTDNALTIYGDILRTNLPVDHPMNLSAQKEISRL